MTLTQSFPVTHTHILRQDLAESNSSLCLAPTLGTVRPHLSPPRSSRPIPKHLHTPGSNGRYSTVQCRISHSSLTSLLRDWSSFVLVEGYSYVKLLSRYAERWAPAPPCPPHPASLPLSPDLTIPSPPPTDSPHRAAH